MNPLLYNNYNPSEEPKLESEMRLPYYKKKTD